jgi:hypothetical protein
MADDNERSTKKPTDRPGPATDADGDHPTEEDAAVEWGERVDTGKTIARGGQESGKVPGATDRKS